MRMGWRSLVRYAVVVVASCSVMAIVLILVNYLLDRYPLLSQILAVGLGAVLAVLLAVGIGSRVIKGIGDWLAIRRTFGTVQGTITAGQMWLAVDGLKVRYFRLRVLRNVREARRVEPSLDSLGVLTELCFSRAGVYGREGGASTGPAKRDTQVEPDETDELFLIREQVRRDIVTCRECGKCLIGAVGLVSRAGETPLHRVRVSCYAYRMRRARGFVGVGPNPARAIHAKRWRPWSQPGYAVQGVGWSDGGIRLPVGRTREAH